MKAMKPKTVFLCLLLMGCSPSLEYEQSLRSDQEAIDEHHASFADNVNRLFSSLSPEEKARMRANCRQAHPSGVMTGVRLGQTIPPEYPLEARLSRWEGRVIVHVTFLPNGRPDQFTVGRSSGYESLDKAAIDAVKQWSFHPAKDGAPMDVTA